VRASLVHDSSKSKNTVFDRGDRLYYALDGQVYHVECQIQDADSREVEAKLGYKSFVSKDSSARETSKPMRFALRTVVKGPIKRLENMFRVLSRAVSGQYSCHHTQRLPNEMDLFAAVEHKEAQRVLTRRCLWGRPQGWYPPECAVDALVLPRDGDEGKRERKSTRSNAKRAKASLSRQQTDLKLRTKEGESAQERAARKKEKKKKKILLKQQQQSQSQQHAGLPGALVPVKEPEEAQQEQKSATHARDASAGVLKQKKKNQEAKGENVAAAAEVNTPAFVRTDPEDGKFKMRCPSCSKQVKLKNKHRGKRLACPQCQTKLKVPLEGNEAALAAKQSNKKEEPKPKPRESVMNLDKSLRMLDSALLLDGIDE
jgi:DNA-directed RNA polymerase subunit RPC12/RpoP